MAFLKFTCSSSSSCQASLVELFHHPIAHISAKIEALDSSESLKFVLKFGMQHECQATMLYSDFISVGDSDFSSVHLMFSRLFKMILDITALLQAVACLETEADFSYVGFLVYINIQAQLLEIISLINLGHKHCNSFRFWPQNQLPSSLAYVAFLAAVAAGYNLNAFGRNAATLATLTQFNIQQGLIFCMFWAIDMIAFCMWKWNFMDFAITWYRPKSHSLPGLIFLSFIVLWIKIRYQNKDTGPKSKPVQSSRSNHQIDNLSKKWMSAQSPKEQQSHIRWLCCKGWKQSLAWIWINDNQSLQPEHFQMKIYVWKPRRNLVWVG